MQLQRRVDHLVNHVREEYLGDAVFLADVLTPLGPILTAALRLDVTKAEKELPWTPVWPFEETVRRTAAGYRRLADAKGAEDARDMIRAEIVAYREAAAAQGEAWAGDSGR